MLFVDGLQRTPETTPTVKWRFARFCHLVSDTSLEELVGFGRRLGLKPEWLQYSKGGVPHFDLTSSLRETAVKAGATELVPHSFKEKMRGGDFGPDFASTTGDSEIP